MNHQTSKQDMKKKRLARQLRQNLKRRKTQKRATRYGNADQTRGLPAAHDETSDISSDEPQ